MRNVEGARRRPTIMIPIPRYVTLIIVDENDELSYDQYD